MTLKIERALRGPYRTPTKSYGKMAAHLAPSEHPCTLDLAWAAGVFEGDGSCGRRPRGGCAADVVQKDRWLPERLRALLGGSVRSYHMGATGQTYFRWTINGARARGFIMTVYGLLSPRRQKQVREVICD